MATDILTDLIESYKHCRLGMKHFQLPDGTPLPTGHAMPFSQSVRSDISIRREQGCVPEFSTSITEVLRKEFAWTWHYSHPDDGQGL